MERLDVEGLKRVLMALANWAKSTGRIKTDLTEAMSDVFYIEDEEKESEGLIAPCTVSYETDTLQIWCDILSRLLGVEPVVVPSDNMTSSEARVVISRLSDKILDRIAAARGLLESDEQYVIFGNPETRRG